MDELPESIGRYNVVRLLAHGAMGRVLLAHDPVLDRPVAIKLLRNDLGLNSEQRDTLLERMRQEARASARVSHPNIVALHDMGDRPQLYLVFEHVEGMNLKERLLQGALGPESSAELVEGLSSALATAHAAGVLHRDIKPDNIILAKHGPKLVDFGIARLPDSTLTHEGGVLGTPAYAAPEAIANGKFTPLSDQFSLAATMYEAISGRRAFPGDDAVAVASRIGTEEPPAIAAVCGVDPHVDTVLARGMSKVPRSRFESIEDFGHALAEALRMSPRAAAPSMPERYHAEQTHAPGWGLRVGVGAAAVGALIAAGALQLSRQLEARPVVAQAPVPLAASIAPDDGDQPVAFLAERPPDKKRKPRRRQRAETSTDAGDSAPRRADAGAASPSASPPGTAKPN